MIRPIDVMLPFCGDEQLLREAVLSVIGQSDPHWRLTVVDDACGGPDLRDWLSGFRDERIRYSRNDHNLGMTRNYRRCVDLARGEFVVIMGSDDLMLPNYISVVRAAHVQSPGSAMVQPGVLVIDGAGRASRTLVDWVKRRYAPRVRGFGVLYGEQLAVSVLRANWLYFPAICWRLGPLEAVSFREDLSVTTDLALVLDLAQRGERLTVCDTTCFCYRRHRGGDSTRRAIDGTRFDEEHRFFAQVADQMDRIGWMHAARASRLHLTSRLHALALLPASIRYGLNSRVLLRHVVGH